MIPQERELKGINIFIIFYLPIISFMEKRGYMRFLGGRPCGSCFSCNYINLSCELFGVALG
jgi:hypothetical protein